MEIREWLNAAARQLAAGESPKRDAEILLGFVLGRPRTWLLAYDETPLTPPQVSLLTDLLARREAGEPIAYLTGEREFWSLRLKVSPVTLIPRPDTECLVEQALALVQEPRADVLDLGTGTGAIALALASERPGWRLTGIDVQAGAAALARENARCLGLTNAAFATGNWFKSLQGLRYTLIVSNPPYIDAEDPHLGRGDVRFEPRGALVAESSGLADLATIINGAGGHLHPGAGWRLSMAGNRARQCAACCPGLVLIG